MSIFHSRDFSRRVVPCHDGKEGYVVFTEDVRVSGNVLKDTAEFIEEMGGLHGYHVTESGAVVGSRVNEICA